MAISGYSERPTQGNNGKAIGVLGFACHATPGYNHGVIGSIGGASFGAGVFGTSNVNTYYGSYVNGRYAGYFDGNVQVTGTINGVVVGSSDIRFKQNIAELGGDDSRN